MTPRRHLRVCHVAYSFYETDNRVMRYAETLAARGDHVDVIALRRPGQSARGRARGVEVYRIQQRSRGEKAAFVYLLKVLWFCIKAFVVLGVAGPCKRYDVVHVHNVPDFLVFAALVPRLLGARVILDIHDVLPEFYAGKFGSREDSALFRALLVGERLSCRFADHVVIANHIWRDKLTRRSVPADRCTAILNYPDAAFFRCDSQQATRPPGAFRVLYPGTLNSHQGVDLAVTAFADVHDRMPGAELHIYGDGPTRESLQALAIARGVAERVRFKDPVPLSEVPKLMASADVGVVPKRADGFGNEAFSTKVLEFMACGVPVIVSRTKVDSHYFEDDSVRFFTPGDAADLGRSLIWAFERPAELSDVAAAGRRRAIEYSWDLHSDEYVDIVDGLTGQGVSVAESGGKPNTSAP